MKRWIWCVVVWMLALPAHAASGGEQEITLAVPGGVLHGTLSLPAVEGRVPVVLLHAGSGPTDRDGNSAMLPGHNDSLRMLADVLAHAGIASVRYDKRGVGASSLAGVREADLQKHLGNDKDPETAVKRDPLEDEQALAVLARKTKPVEFGSKDDFQLAQALNHFKGLPVKLSKADAAAASDVGETKPDTPALPAPLQPATKAK